MLTGYTDGAPVLFYFLHFEHSIFLLTPIGRRSFLGNISKTKKTDVDLKAPLGIQPVNMSHIMLVTTTFYDLSLRNLQHRSAVSWERTDVRSLPEHERQE